MFSGLGYSEFLFLAVIAVLLFKDLLARTREMERLRVQFPREWRARVMAELDLREERRQWRWKRGLQSMPLILLLSAALALLWLWVLQ